MIDSLEIINEKKVRFILLYNKPELNFEFK